jgi:hypothetical protein
MEPDLDVTPAAALCGLLATPERLKVVAALALGAGTVAEVGGAAGLDLRQAAQALARLQTGGLVEQSTQGNWRLRTEVFAAAAAEPVPRSPRSLAGLEEGEPNGTVDADAAKLLRTFMPGGRLASFPASHRKRRVILDHVARAFEPGRDYAEGEVDAVLRGFCQPDERGGHTMGGAPADHVTLRRYLVDHGFLSRRDGRYWRSGGTVELD